MNLISSNHRWNRPRRLPCYDWNPAHSPAYQNNRARVACRALGKERPAAALPHRPFNPRVCIGFRPYQLPVFMDRSTGILVLHWSRQIGKSFTLAAWAVDRLLTRPGRLVTVLSNSRENGAEFVAKCAQVCRMNGTKFEFENHSHGVRFQNMRYEIRVRSHGHVGRIKVLAANPRTARGFSGDLILDEFAFHEDSRAIWEAAEPILAANPDFLCRIASTGNGKHNLFYRMTANAPDAFHWLPAPGTSPAPTAPEPPSAPLDVEPPSAKTSMLNVECSLPSDPAPVIQPETSGVLASTGISLSPAGFAVSRITRTQAWQTGVLIYDTITREPITPEQARAKALDKRAYDQNYECAFADENATLLSHELINAAERDDVGFICDQDWSNVVLGSNRVSRVPAGVSPDALTSPLDAPKLEPERTTASPSRGGEGRDEGGRSGCLAFLRSLSGPLFVGFDVARKGDLSVITVVEKIGSMQMVRAILRMTDLRLPDQQSRLGEICKLPTFRRAAIDMTGLGLGLFEYAQQKFGASRIVGINFATSVPVTRAIARSGGPRQSVRVTEALAMELLQTFEDRRIQHPVDERLRDDLRRPEKITTPGGRVSIAAARNEAGHADHFWSFALALEAASRTPNLPPGHCGIELIPRRERTCGWP